MPGPDDDILTLIENFQHIVRSNDNSALKPADSVILERITAFSTASQTIIPQLIKKMQETMATTPPWAQMHGIFRFVHPYDPAQKKQEQKELCDQVRKKMMAGIDIKEISKQFSQAGSRRFASILPRLYLNQDRQKDQELARLLPGQVSRIYEEENGYWCYKIIEKGGGEVSNFSDIPWPARRVLFRQKILGIKKIEQL